MSELGLTPTVAAFVNGDVATLRRSGFKVRVTHFRRYLDDVCKVRVAPMFKVRDAVPTIYRDIDVLPNGGKTVVEVRTPDGREFTAEAGCHVNDRFSKSVGVKTALNRVLQQIVAEGA